MLKLKKISNEDYDLSSNIESSEVLESLKNKINNMSINGWVKPNRWVEQKTFGCSFANPSLGDDCWINFTFTWEDQDTGISDYHVDLYDYNNYGLIPLTSDRISIKRVPKWDNSLSIDQNIDKILRHLNYILNLLPGLSEDELRDLSY